MASFASSNLGDVSPNVMGPKCHESGKECNIDSTCETSSEPCFALGPGQDMFESTKIIAERLVDKAWVSLKIVQKSSFDTLTNW